MMTTRSGRMVACWVAVLLLLGAGRGLWAAEAAKSVAITVKSTGEVLLSAAGSKSEKALKTGDRLNDGDRIRTGADGRAVLVFTDDKSQLKLTPQTDLVLHANRQGGRTDKEVELSAGTLWSKVTRQQGEFRIATPTSVASVKGTAWWTKSGPALTEIITEEGIVALISRRTGESVDVVMGRTGSSDGDHSDVRDTTSGDQQGLERGELRRVVVPITDGDQQRELIIEYYE
jgi:hypothetical protein